MEGFFHILEHNKIVNLSNQMKSYYKKYFLEMIKLASRPSRPSTVTWRRLTVSTSSCSSIGRRSRNSWCRFPSMAARQSAATTAGPTPRRPHRDPPSTRPFRGSRIDTVMKAKPRLMSSARSYRSVNLC